jgi:hypothetical protein
MPAIGNAYILMMQKIIPVCQGSLTMIRFNKSLLSTHEKLCRLKYKVLFYINDYIILKIAVVIIHS